MKINICNGCKYLNAWYNGGMECHARCKLKVWPGIRSWPPKTALITPNNCHLEEDEDEFS